MFLSNMYHCEMEYNGLFFYSVESAYQAQKCLYEKDRIIFTKIKDPVEAKRLGGVITKRKDWDKIKLNIMKELLEIKFSQNYFIQKLLDTNDSILIEGNDWHDNFYGVCRCDQCKYLYQNNFLGKILMNIREERKSTKIQLDCELNNYHK